MAQNRSKNAASSSIGTGSASSPGGTTAQVDGADVLVTDTELGSWLGCSGRSVREYREAGVIKAVRPGRYALKSSVRAIAEHLRDRAAGWTATSTEGETMSPAAESAALNRQKRLLAIEQTRVAATRAEVAETELAIVRGRVLDVEQIVGAWSAIITAAKGRLMGLAPRLATQIHGLDRKEVEIISSEVRTILDQLVEDGARVHTDAAADAIKRRRAAAAAHDEDNTIDHDGD
jgi:phage terminase Nu1 subunit (DNA packaging protein)